MKRYFRVARTDTVVHETVVALDADEIREQCGEEPGLHFEGDVYTMAEEAADATDEAAPWTFTSQSRDFQCLGQVGAPEGEFTPAIVSYLTGYADGLIKQMDRSLPFDHWFETDAGIRIHLITKDDGYENLGAVEAWAYGSTPSGGAALRLEVKNGNS